ncbi:PREDICTED: uncharacterized protein LOC104613375 isoform X2 [Nelumbo nucifera]|uniref:Uncharacterized protein LOC104613375 isoform X2 n=1 Tax=Nelumbo nucifera TaxID=4432 RepID=A0A1U8BPK9_NELNU|nr:PREDICTED: uncharacterized protein LOC104613375 isoform X2 [Nelumbo nucifera]
MQSGAAENEVRVKSSAASSSHPANQTPSAAASPSSAGYVTSGVSSAIPSGPGFTYDGVHAEEKPKINGVGKRMIDEGMERGKLFTSTIPVPSLISVTAETAEACSMNFAHCYGVGGGAEEDARLERFLKLHQGPMAPAVATVPVLQSQPSFVHLGTYFNHAGSELTTVFPGINNSWSPQSVGSPYQFQFFPYSNMCISSAGAPNFKQKVEVSGSSQNPSHMESFLGHIASSFYQDAVFQPTFMPIQAMFPSLFATEVRGPPFNYSLSAAPVMHEPVKVPTHKRKVVHLSCSNSLIVSEDTEGNKNANLEPSYRNQVPALQVHSGLEGTPIVGASPTSSTDPQPMHEPEDGKEIEGRGLRVLVQKELRNTDVGSLGRIVLPKKDAEANLPPLAVKDGLILQMEDMIYSVKWHFKYRFWPNNRSRMYVMENTGEFVKMHRLQAGDLFIIYKEESSGKYVVRGKNGKRTLYAGDMPVLIDHGNAEKRVMGANEQHGPEQGASVLVGGYVAPNSTSFATGEPFDFESNTGGPSQFSPPPLLDLDPERNP